MTAVLHPSAPLRAAVRRRLDAHRPRLDPGLAFGLERWAWFHGEQPLADLLQVFAEWDGPKKGGS